MKTVICERMKGNETSAAAAPEHCLEFSSMAQRGEKEKSTGGWWSHGIKTMELRMWENQKGKNLENRVQKRELHGQRAPVSYRVPCRVLHWVLTHQDMGVRTETIPHS